MRHSLVLCVGLGLATAVSVALPGNATIVDTGDLVLTGTDLAIGNTANGSRAVTSEADVPYNSATLGVASGMTGGLTLDDALFTTTGPFNAGVAGAAVVELAPDGGLPEAPAISRCHQRSTSPLQCHERCARGGLERGDRVRGQQGRGARRHARHPHRRSSRRQQPERRRQRRRRRDQRGPRGAGRRRGRPRRDRLLHADERRQVRDPARRHAGGDRLRGALRARDLDARGVARGRARERLSPTIGDAFEVLHTGAFAGQFDSYLGLDVGNGVFLVPEYGPNSLVLRAVPEPGTALLVGLGSMGLSAARKRKA